MIVLELVLAATANIEPDGPAVKVAWFVTVALEDNVACLGLDEDIAVTWAEGGAEVFRAIAVKLFIEGKDFC